MVSKNNKLFLSSVIDDIRRVVAENAEACGRARDSISKAVRIIPEVHRPTRDFQVVKR